MDQVKIGKFIAECRKNKELTQVDLAEKLNVTDKYKHAYMNCVAAQYGQGGADIATLASNLREWNDVRTGSNTLDSSQGDQYANKIGRLLGGKYPKGDCDELVQRYIDRHY